MPHIIVEHSSDISNKNVVDFLPKIQQELAQIEGGNFSLEACKARSLQFDEYFVGSKNQENSAFFHITIKILSGRSLQIKQETAQKIAKIAEKFLLAQNLKKERTDLSVDIVDMEKEIYQKIILPA